jgi:hypothetical protein
VVSSLAEDQTGANLKAGTNSLNDALHNFGLPGDSARKTHGATTRSLAPSPLYVLPRSPEVDADGDPVDFDDDAEIRQVIDREGEDFQRFLNELERMSSVEQLPSIEGDVSFDCFESLANSERTIPPSLWESAKHLEQLFAQNDYEIELTVWAATPSQSAWIRSAEQADELRDAITGRLQLSAESAVRFHAVSRPWMYSNLDRPTASLTVRRLKSE